MSTAEPALVTEAQAVAPDSPQERPSLRAWYALAVLIVAVLFGFVNGRILLLMAEFIKRDLSMSDLQLGETHGVAPAIFGIIAVYPLAWLADRFERRTVLTGCVIFWSIATAASGLAWDFPTLLACSVAITVGEVALLPIIWSLIPDLFPVKYRPRAYVIVYAATILGAGLATSLGGASIGAIDSLRPLLPASIQALQAWRLVFFLIALPGPIVALAVYSIGRTRRTAGSAQGPSTVMPMAPYARKHGLVALGIYFTVGLFQFAVQGMGTWLLIALIRTFKADAASVGMTFGICFMAGAAIGLALAAVLTPFWRRRAGTAFVLRAVSFVAILLAVHAILLPFTANITQAYILIACWPAIFVTVASLMPNMMVDIVPEALRTRVVAVGGLFAFGQFISSPLIGFFSDQMGDVSRGLMWAMVVVAVPALLVCAALARFMEAPYRRTVAAVGNS